MVNSSDSLPPITLIPLAGEALQSASADVTSSHSPIADPRWTEVEAFLSSRPFAVNTRKVYRRELKRFLDWTNLSWEEIRSPHLRVYKQYLIDLLTDQDQLRSKSSINSAITALKSFFKWWSNSHPDPHSDRPTAGIQFEKLSLSPRSLTPAELQRVWQALEQFGETRQRDTVLVHLLTHSLKAGEIINLTVGSFDDRQILLSHASKQRSQFEPVRFVPLRPESQLILQRYLDWRQDQEEALEQDSPLLPSHHPHRLGQQLSYHGLYFAIAKIGRLADIPDLYPHQFHHIKV